jgi:hypothetical protein
VAGGGEERRQHDRERPRGLGDDVDRWGPLGSDVRERRHHCWNAQTQRKDAFGQIRQGCLGRMG